MSDYRNPDDPSWRNAPYDPDGRSYNVTWGWIAGAVFLVVVLAIAFGIKHESNDRTASNDIAPPAATRLAPPPTAMNPERTPMAPPQPMAPAPAPQGNNHP
jgi:hypothetical protein